MNKKIICLGIVSIFLFSSFAFLAGANKTKIHLLEQKKEFEISNKIKSYDDGSWNKSFGGKKNDDLWYIEQTSDSGFIISGYTNSYGAGDLDGWVIKTDEYGNEVWSKTFGGPYEDGVAKVKETVDNGYILVGYTTSYGAGSSDIWVIKIDGNGNELWNKTFGESNWDWGINIEQVSDGGFIFVGNSYITYPSGGYDYFIRLIKLDENGNEEWNKTLGKKNEKFICYALQITNEEEYMLLCSNIYSKLVLLKTDNLGNKILEKGIAIEHIDHYIGSLKITSDGYIISGGMYSDKDAYLIKTDFEGNVQWNKIFEITRYRYILTDAVETDDGGYIVSGYTSLSYADRPYNFYLWLLKFSHNGEYMWSKTYGSKGESGYQVRQTNDGGYVVVGYTISNSAGGCDGWLLKQEKITGLAPKIPSKPCMEGNIFNTTTTDPEGDRVKYFFYWGDGSSTWTELVESGQTVEVEHTWQSELPSYLVKVKAVDENGLESEWSDELLVPHSRDMQLYKSLFSKLIDLFPRFEKIYQRLLNL